MNTIRRNAIFALWDELADFPAAQCDAALRHLLRRLCQWFDAQDAVWVGAARVGQGASARRDPLLGWRGLVVHHHNSSPEILARSLEAVKTQETHPDLTTRALAAGTGILRVHRLRDGFVDWRAMKKSGCLPVIYGKGGVADRIFAGVPVNADAESFILIDYYDNRRFTAQDADCVEFLMRGLKWFHRELLLANGLLLAGAPLSGTERRITRLLLTNRSETQIAAELGQSPKTTHKYITDILRKYGVKRRTGLMALWLGRGHAEK